MCFLKSSCLQNPLFVGVGMWLVAQRHSQGWGGWAVTVPSLPCSQIHT